MLKVIAPTRIDLAGGTLDVYPLYLFAYPISYSTINMAINLYNEVTLDELESTKIIITSDDLQLTEKFKNLEDLEKKLPESQLELITKAVHFFKVEGVHLTIKSSVPRGSGLGNSSSLLIAVIFLLNEFTDSGYSKTQQIKIALGIETSVLKIPTGRQDYIAAMYGGVNIITFGLLEDDIKQVELSADFRKYIEQQTGLFYVGEPKRFASPRDNPNWDVIKNIVDSASLDLLDALNRITADVKQALITQNYQKFILHLQQETEIRKNLSNAILTPKMQAQIETIEFYKICGAGGGGMLWILEDAPNLQHFSIDTLGARIIKTTTD